MKKIILVAFFSLNLYQGNSQTVKEWVQQKKTQIEYLVNQIIGLRAYADVVSKGYQTAKNGLATINRIKEGDFSLHNDHLTLLRTVSSSVGSSPALQQAFLKWNSIQLSITRVRKLCSLEGGLTLEERNYVKSVLAGLQTLCAVTVEDLKRASQSGYLSLSDDERLKRIAALGMELTEAHGFLLSFEKGVKLLAISRLKDSKDTRVLKKLYGIQ